MNRQQFKNLTQVRVRESRVLLEAGHYPGAYYLLGYAVECALKACIAKQVRLHDFPDKKVANDAFTHDLEKLVRVSGLMQELEDERKANPNFDSNWMAVKDWSESVRYETAISSTQARDLLKACTGRDGVLPWVKRRW